METAMVRTSLSVLFASLSAAVGAAAPPSAIRTLEESTEVATVLGKIAAKGIPPRLLNDAKAVAIIPNTIKAGFVVGGRKGNGLVLTKSDAGEWGEPTFVTLGGASVGFQAGVQVTDVVLVFKKRETLDNVLSGKGRLTLGADAAIAAGPLGREAAAATDAKLNAEILSYSRSRGLFAGVSLDGAAILHDKDVNDQYKADGRPDTAKAVAELKVKLTELAKEPPAENKNRK
jgi:lipid-binding SYLF domain-containing protein